MLGILNKKSFRETPATATKEHNKQKRPDEQEQHAGGTGNKRATALATKKQMDLKRGSEFKTSAQQMLNK